HQGRPRLCARADHGLEEVRTGDSDASAGLWAGWPAEETASGPTRNSQWGELHRVDPFHRSLHSTPVQRQRPVRQGTNQGAAAESVWAERTPGAYAGLWYGQSGNTAEGNRHACGDAASTAGAEHPGSAPGERGTCARGVLADARQAFPAKG